ncbi:MAG: cupin domain-containing protein [Phycisphaerae bacterium]|nr:cupin domain-containing protein [Phycisphaerae bacterium]
MILKSVENVPNEPVDMEGAKGAHVRWLISQKDGAPTFAMRLFEVAPGGHTPHHAHPYEHEVFVVEGAGIAVSADGERPFNTGDALFVPADEMHQFRNTSRGVCKFLCMIPSQKSCDR